MFGEESGQAEGHHVVLDGEVAASGVHSMDLVLGVVYDDDLWSEVSSQVLKDDFI